MDRNERTIKGTRVDWKGLKKAIDKRWELIEPKRLGTMHCKKHDTYFKDGNESGNEPCWQCYNEFEKEV